MATVKLKLRIIARPATRKAYVLMLEGEANVEEMPLDFLTDIIFNIERTLNEHMPHIRVHSEIEVTGKNVDKDSIRNQT